MQAGMNPMGMNMNNYQPTPGVKGGADIPVAKAPVDIPSGAEANVAAAAADQMSEIVKKEVDKSESIVNEEVEQIKQDGVDDVEVEKAEASSTNEIDKQEQAMIDDMKNAISESSAQVARKVNKSAFNFMAAKKKWFKEENTKDAEEFFTIKIPKVMARELSKILNEALGLEIQEDSNDQDAA